MLKRIRGFFFPKVRIARISPFRELRKLRIQFNHVFFWFRSGESLVIILNSLNFLLLKNPFQLLTYQEFPKLSRVEVAHALLVEYNFAFFIDYQCRGN